MKLLVAEDDRALGEFLRRGLEADGYRVRLASDGAAAIEAFHENLPDLMIGVAGTDGRGTIEGGETEASNVNISQEFSDLIVAQRPFEANSKAVTTFDTVTQETINMIH